MTNTDSFEEIMTDLALLMIDAGNAGCDPDGEIRDDFVNLVNRLRSLPGDHAELISDAEGVICTLTET